MFFEQFSSAFETLRAAAKSSSLGRSGERCARLCLFRKSLLLLIPILQSKSAIKATALPEPVEGGPASVQKVIEVLSKNFKLIQNYTLRTILIFFLLATTACSYRMRIASRPQTPIFIAMPINDSAAEPVSQLLYDALVGTFQRQGYDVASWPQQAYVLKTTVQYLTPTQHFISQDVVLLHKLVQLKAICSLYNFRKELVLEKTFTFEAIISKALAPLQQDAYMVHSLGGMLERHIQIIEQTFRRHLQ